MASSSGRGGSGKGKGGGRKRQGSPRVAPDDIQTKAEERQEKRRVRELERALEISQERIESLQRERWTIPLQRSGRKGSRGFVRVVIPDTHGCLVHEQAVGAFLADLDTLDAKEVVWLGDHLECGGFLAQHWTLGYVAQTEYTFEEDVDAANDLLDQVQARTKGAEHHYLEGNHERRLESWVVSQALKHSTDADYLRRMFCTESQLHLADRKINHYAQGKFYHDCRIPSTIKLGHCYFTHGHTSAKHAAAKMLEKFGACVVFGHIHRMQQASASTVSDGTMSAWCPGCMCRLMPLWRHTAPTDWNHGYAVQLVQADGSFLHINVPILEGRSYLMQLTDRIGKGKGRKRNGNESGSPGAG